MALLVAGLLIAAGAPANEAYQSSTIIGTQPDLAAGARALQLRQFDDGVRLTLQGLKLEVSRRQRASGLSNLCAGYAALERYDEAIESCNAALDLNAPRWRVYNNRALALLGKGQVIAARRDVDAGLALNPDSNSLRKVLQLVEVAEISPEITIAAVAP
jgi:tetratricopeptide (TPR) repeat protein